ncbi:MAG: hypothetical protein JO218_01795 [Burkholderiales bacterium]|nr:hypothetical protein [Burkholderiales bacterium]
MLRPLFLIGICGTFALACQAASAACPSEPRELSATLVGDNILVNDHPVSIVAVHGHRSAAEQIEATVNQWRSENDRVTVNRLGQWIVAAALTQDCLATLELEAGKGDGYYSVSRKGAPRVAPSGLPLRLPEGVGITSSVVTNDSGRIGYTLTLRSSLGSEDLMNAFAHALDEQHWESITGHTVARKGVSSTARILTARQGHRQVEVVAMSGSPTQAILNLSDTL